MALKDNIYHLRSKARLSQAEFAEKFGVTHQSVQKWEGGQSQPSLEVLIKMSKLFGVSLDAILFSSNARIEEERPETKKIYPSYESLQGWELYSEQLDCEYRQLLDEGAEVAPYRELFESVGRMERGRYKTQMADILFEMSRELPQREGYPYREPSDLESIRCLRAPFRFHAAPLTKKAFREKLAGAWYGRICGCLLGKPVEGIRTEELHPLLKESGNWPMHRYILSTDITEEMIAKFDFPLRGNCYADTVSCAPVDDDTNYTVLYQKIVEKYGRDFTPADVARAWVEFQPKDAYCTAERVAFRNFVAGYRPPDSASYQNPYREWIGAQIRGDYFGYINPGDPELAAEMAWRDASISHTKNGIYGEMWAAAMIAAAAVCDDLEEIIEAGLAQIPAASRLYEAVQNILKQYRAGVPEETVFRETHTRWDEHNGYDWCHTVSNAEIVAASLLYGEGEYGRSICRAVQTGFDTDCNGATVGSVLGMKNGLGSIPEEWRKPIGGKQATTIFGVDTVEVESLIETAMEHAKL